MSLKTIYGHEVKDLSAITVVSAKEARRLLANAIEQDKVRARYGLPPIVNTANVNVTANKDEDHSNLKR